MMFVTPKSPASAETAPVRPLHRPAIRNGKDGHT